MPKAALPLLLLLGLAAAAAAAAAPRAAVETPARAGAPGWSGPLRRASPDASVRLVVALRHAEPSWALRTLEAVSDPASPAYRRFASREQVRAAMAPLPAAVPAARAWLLAAGVPPSAVRMHGHGDMLSARVSVRQAELLLDAEYYEHEHAETGIVARRCAAYTVPAALAPLVDFVGGTTRLPTLHRGGHRGAASLRRDGAAAPAQDRAAVAAAAAGAPPAPRYVSGMAGDGSVEVFFAVDAASAGGSQPRLAVRVNGTAVASAAVTSCETHSNGDTVCGVSVPLPGARNYVPWTVTAAQVSASGAVGAYSDPPQFAEWGTRFVTPAVLKAYHGVPGSAVGSGAATQSVAEFLGQYYAPEDLRAFADEMGLGPLAAVPVVGPNNASQPGGEATLDIEYIMGVAENVTTTFWSEPALHEGQEAFLQWLTDVHDAASPPLVHSVSYSDEEDSLSPEYMQRVSIELQKLGAMGLSVLICSLDDGVAGPSARGNQTAAQVFRPVFPASSPYATAVGATQFSTDTLPVCGDKVRGLPVDCSEVGEKGCDSRTGGVITSGGGFSSLFPRPAYQEDAVERYLSTAGGRLPPSSLFNRSNAAYPDVSANGHSYLIVQNGELGSIHGTSASTPVVAAFVALINDRLVARGEPPLGFLNPLLYSLAATRPEVFNDILVGDNSCTAFTPPFTSCSEHSYEAQHGFDPVTGLGSPNFLELARAVGVTF